ncbi:hypothetical protein [Alicyclobacillus sp. ALC3]|nr:hypothetical protein [Alicyclobacillus sp. ALC3]
MNRLKCIFTKAFDELVGTHHLRSRVMREALFTELGEYVAILRG